MTQDREEQIRARAHAIWEAEGKPHGRDALHWDQATRDMAGDPDPQDQAEEEAQAAIDVVEDARAATARKMGKTPRPAAPKAPKKPK